MSSLGAILEKHLKPARRDSATPVNASTQPEPGRIQEERRDAVQKFIEVLTKGTKANPDWILTRLRIIQFMFAQEQSVVVKLKSVNLAAELGITEAAISKALKEWRGKIQKIAG